MPKDYARRNSSRRSNNTRKKTTPRKRSSKSSNFPWVPLFILVGFVGILIFIFLGMSGKIHMKWPRKTNITTIKVQRNASGAVVESATPVKFNKNKRAENEKVRFDFYTLLPKMKVDVANTASKAKSGSAQVKYYVLQLASFKDVARAQVFQDSLKKKGFSTKRLLMTHHGERWYRIQIGPIYSFSKVQSVRQSLRDKDVSSVLLRFKI